jgi:hypothetical protein
MLMMIVFRGMMLGYALKLKRSWLGRKILAAERLNLLSEPEPDQECSHAQSLLKDISFHTHAMHANAKARLYLLVPRILRGISRFSA